MVRVLGAKLPLEARSPSVGWREYSKKPAVLAEDGYLSTSRRGARVRPRLLHSTLAVLAACVVLLAPVSVGAATSHVARHMPNLIGRNRAQVYAIMRHDALYFVTSGSSNGRWVAVVAQSPRAGTVVAWHSQAALRVTTQSPTGPRPVPRLRGLSRAGVYAALRTAQLYFKTVGPGSSNASWTVALAQSPPAGTMVPWHGEVTVQVTTRRPAPVTKTAPTKVSSVVINGANYKIGVATWYNYFPGRCATSYLPKGTRITVRDLATSKAITCVITDREDAGGNRVVDLNETQFAQLEPLWKGVISVRVSW